MQFQPTQPIGISGLNQQLDAEITTLPRKISDTALPPDEEPRPLSDEDGI